MNFNQWWATLTDKEQFLLGQHNARFVWDAAATAERERIKQANVAEIEKVNAHIKSLEKALTVAKEEEREACAKVCEENATDLSEGDWDPACINCANRIRARGNT